MQTGYERHIPLYYLYARQVAPVVVALATHHDSPQGLLGVVARFLRTT